MKQDEWAERLRHHLEDYREEPKRDLWEDIEGALEKTAHRKTRVVLMRRWMAAAVIAGLSVAGAYMLWLQKYTEETNNPSKLAIVSSKPELSVAYNKSIDKNNIAKTIDQALRTVTTISEEEHQHPLEQKTEPIQEVSPTPKDQTPTEEQTPIQNRPHYDLPQPIEREVKSTQRRQVTMGLYASATSSNYNSRNGVLMSPLMLSNYVLTRGNAAYLNGYEERQSHDQPISFGLTFSYPLTERLSVSSGIVYTKLNSDFITIMQENQIHRHQTLHYVGIPLNIQIALWQWNKLNVYVAAGGQADWNVEAKANTDGVNQEMEKDRLQWSVGGSLGVQYNIMPQLGVYAEPGFRHYIDNGSNVSNFFKDKPTDFNLQVGLRFNF